MRLVFIFLLLGCNTNPYAINRYRDVTHYQINYTEMTPNGVGVDANGQLDLNDIDRRTNEVEACLSKLYPDGMLPPDVVKASSCIVPQFNPSIQREWIGVKLAPDWFHACYDEHWQFVGPGKGEQIFPGEVDPKLCEAKGFVVTKECPCGYRAIIQGNSTIVVTPNMHLYKSELIRLITGCNGAPWGTELAICYSAN